MRIKGDLEVTCMPNEERSVVGQSVSGLVISSLFYWLRFCIVLYLYERTLIFLQYLSCLLHSFVTITNNRNLFSKMLKHL